MRSNARRHSRRLLVPARREVITANPVASLGDIAAMLEHNRIKRVPNVEGNKLAGHRHSRKYSAGIGERDQKTPFPYNAR